MKTTITVADGYKLIKRAKYVDFNMAFRLLCGRAQKRFSQAENKNDSVLLVSHVIRCPHCSKETPAYRHFLYDDVKFVKQPLKKVLFGWLNLQLNFLGDNSTIGIQTPIFTDRIITCPKCGNLSSVAKKDFKFFISGGKNFVYIERKLESLEDLLTLSWVKNVSLSPKFPLFERIRFDFEKNAVLLQLICNQTPLFETNITESFAKSRVVEIIDTNHTLKKKLKQSFENCLQTPFFADKGNICFASFVFATRFTGFNKSFYEHIPHGEGYLLEDSELNLIARQLKTPKSAAKLFCDSRLPKSKRIKKVFFENPEMLFFIKEYEQLFDAVEDLNLFYRLITNEQIGSVTALLHTYPDTFDFLNDYVAVKCAKKLCESIASQFEDVIAAAVKYNSMNRFGKDLEQRKWKNEKDYFCGVRFSSFGMNGFSLAMQTPPKQIPDCCIGAYRFKWLKSFDEYFKVGNIMHNCLSSWSYTSNPVTVVLKGNRPVAAIEVQGKSILQALLPNNQAIKQGTPISNAIVKWCRRYDIEWFCAE